jgi:hypothetical protein
VANTIYPLGRQGFAGGDIAWDSDTIKLVACDSGYVYNAAHDMLDDVAGAARVATSSAFTTKTIANGVLDADDVTLSAVTAGDTITSVVVYQDSGVESTSRLILFFDTKADTTAISVATNGGDVIITWSNTSTRIAQI